MPLQARTELLALIGLLYTSLRSRFDAEDTAQVFVWVEKFSRNPWSGMLGTNVLIRVCSVLAARSCYHMPGCPLLEPFAARHTLYCMHLKVFFC